MNVKKLKLATMFSVMFAGAFITVSAVFYYYNYTKQVTAQNATLKLQAKSVLDFADVLLESRNEKFFSGESSETPQIIQNEVFDKFTKISGGKVFFKEASKTPTDPKNLATKNENDIIDFLIKNRDVKEYQKTIKIKGEDYYTLSRPIISEKKCLMCHLNWTPNNVIAAETVKIELKDFYEDLKENTILTVLTGFINIIIILILTHFLFQKYVSKRITKLLELIFRVEKGNFIIEDLLKDEQLAQGSSKNEIDRLFRHLKKMVESLKPVITNVVHASKNMAFQSSYSYIKIDNTNNHVQSQNSSLAISKQKLDDILNVNSQMIASLDEVTKNAHESKQTVIESKNDVNNNMKQGNEAADAMDQTSHSINDLKIFSNEVSKMTEIITDIADETNLIALNAAIEAARAGEHGRSFSVVADKIRELAEVSRSNADEISSVLAKIDTQINVVTSSAVNSKKSVLSLVENSHKINESFEKVDSTFNLISTSLNTFHQDFLDESTMLEEVNNNLSSVQESSKKLVQNTEVTKEIMTLISMQSADLKTLADGFEVVLNARGNQRTVLTPPLVAIDEHNNIIYVFDISDNGVSFYYEKSLKQYTKGERVTLKPNKSINNRNQINCEIIYISDNIMKDVYFYGAKIL